MGGLGKGGLSHGRVQADVGALGGAQVQALGNRLDRKRGLAPQPHRQRNLDRIALAPGQQVSLPAVESPQFFGDDGASALASAVFQPQLPQVVLSDLAVNPLEELLAEVLAAQQPTPPQGLDLLVAGLYSRRASIRRSNSCRAGARCRTPAHARQATGPRAPKRADALARPDTRPDCSTDKPAAAPRLEQTRAHGIEMHVITSGAQVAVAAALDQLGLVATAKHMSDQPVPVIEPDGIGALNQAMPATRLPMGVSSTR